MPNKLDLLNQKFNYLTVIKEAPSRNGKTYWLCQCDCGKQKEIQTTHLKNGKTRSCGCELGKILPKEEQNIQKCEICGKEFTQTTKTVRKYCFECAPANCSSTERTSQKRRAAKQEGVKRLGGCCKKCGENRPYVLAFHHLDGNEKDNTPSRFLANSQFEVFFEEIKKCILLCNNCHSEFHYFEANENLTIEEYLS